MTYDNNLSQYIFMDVTVRKTNGSFEEYDKVKLMNGIREAYKTAGEECPEAVVVSIAENLYIYDKITSREIRRQVEESLMSINKKVAIAYIEKFDAGLDLRKKRDFIKDYIAASNAATGSKFDANANVTRKNIVTLGQELYKENNIKQNRYIMKDKIKALYGRSLASQYIKDLESHVLYKHDESGTPGYPYCVAITMYRVNRPDRPQIILRRVYQPRLFHLFPVHGSCRHPRIPYVP